MNRPNRRLVRVALNLIACLSVAPLAVAADEKPAAKKRPRTDSNTPFVHRIPLRDETDNVITFPKPGADAEKAPKTKLASITTTCGKCHDYPTVSGGWHFNAGDAGVPAGRAGEPWILTDESVIEDVKGPSQSATRTQLPMSYRKWPGTWRPADVGYSDWKFAYSFGRHSPGGGALESSKDQRFNVTGNLQNDCLICHVADNNYSGQARFEQITKFQNFKYATLVAAGVGHAEKSREKLKDTWTPPDPNDPNSDGPPEPPFEYDAGRINAKGQVLFNVSRRVPNERCYFCHTSMDTGTAGTNDLKQRWRHDRDIHLVKGMLCVDCHKHGLDHAVTRGYEGEAIERKDPGIASLSCQGCHYGSNSATATGTDLGGRNAAPRPQHKGLPVLHFDKLSCTACHSGPWPGEQATSVLTSMAHRLGLESFNRVDDAAPTIQEPVFLRDGQTGKITPHKVLYPTFWARMNGDAITPLTPDVLNASSALRKIFGARPDNDLQPLKPLTEEQIIKALDAIADMEAPSPKGGAKAAATAPSTPQAATAPVAPPLYTGEPVFVTGGKAYKRASGKLTSFDHAAAKPYAWALAHDVRGAQEALGARGCTDCHAAGAPVFDGKVSSAAILASATTTTPMHALRGDSMGALTAFAASYPMRPILIATGFTCAGILGLVLLAYATRAVGAVGRRRIL